MTIRTFSFILAFAICPCTLRGADGSVVTVRLLAPNPNVCVGQSTLGFEAVLTNTSGRAIRLSDGGVRGGLRIYEFKENKPELKTSYLAEIIPSVIKNGRWIWIPPHQSAVLPFAQPLTGEPLLEHVFDSPGLFRIEIVFQNFGRSPDNSIEFRGEVESNPVMFKVSDCKNGEK
jgi:hypothetical protein